MKRMRTKPLKGFSIFLSIVFVLSVLTIIYFALTFSSQAKAFAIIVFVFAGLFSITSLLILIDQLFHYTELKDGAIINHIFFFKKSIKVEKIKKLILKDGIYKIYTEDKLFVQIPSGVIGAPEIIVGLEKLGVHLK